MTTEAGLAITIGCMAVLTLEQVLAAKWNHAYFRSGLLLFRQRSELGKTTDADRIEEALNLSLETAFWSPLLFRRLPDDTVAFRERFWPPAHFQYYLPLMHGSIKLLAPRTIEVTGRSNWGVPLLVIVVALRIFGVAGVELVAVWLLFFAFMYGLQAMRYRKVSWIAVHESVGMSAAEQ